MHFSNNNNIGKINHFQIVSKASLYIGDPDVVLLLMIMIVIEFDNHIFMGGYKCFTSTITNRAWPSC